LLSASGSRFDMDGVIGGNPVTVRYSSHITDNILRVYRFGGT